MTDEHCSKDPLIDPLLSKPGDYVSGASLFLIELFSYFVIVQSSLTPAHSFFCRCTKPGAVFDALCVLIDV